jgi:predicted ribosomally synthesized peptide with SipW-like signal peptide
MAIGGLAAVLGTASQAIWTDSDDVDANDFTTGSVTIGAVPTTDVLNLTLAKPGDTTGPVNIEVQNTGSLNFIYSVSAASAPATDLDTEMDLEVRLDDSTVGGDATPADPCDEFDGTRLHLSGGPGDLVPAGGLIIGDPAAGNQGTPGGGDRTLNASTTEDLCFKVTLPTAAPNSAQGLTTVVTFTFFSEQL